MKNYLLLLLVLNIFFPSLSYTQIQTPVEHEINLPPRLSTKDKPYEFSCLASWKNYTLLIPAFKNPSKDTACIYAIEAPEIIKSLNNSKYVVKVNSIALDMKSLKKCMPSIDNSSYDGIEGAVVVGDNIYLVIETHSEDCYILKGTFRNTGSKLNLEFTKSIPLHKPYKCEDDNNAGFEGITFIENTSISKKPLLIAIFEGCPKQNKHPVYYIDPTTLSVSSAFTLETKRRIPDIFFDKKSNGLFILATVETSKDDKCTFIKKLDSTRSFPTRNVAKLNNIGCYYNWEGVTTFKDGILVINDNYNKPADKDKIETKLSYFEINF